MNRLLAAALFGLSATGAIAADMPGPVASSTYNWSGIYVGVGAGVADGNISATDNTFPSGGFFTDLVPAGTEGFDFDDTAIAGGVHLGAQYQWQQIVFGAEASWTATGIDEKITSPYFPDIDTETGKIEHYVTAVGRLGFAFDRFMIYAKGGYAGGEVGFKARDNESFVTYEQSEWHNGYALGGGVEYALTNSLILGLDYTHIDLGSKESTGDNKFDNGTLGVNPETYKTSADADIVMARISYKFGGGQ